MKAILALLIVIAGVAGGGALGLVLKPAPDPDAEPAEAPPEPAPVAEPGAPEVEPAYVKLGRQMIVPVVEGGETKALMVFEIALDLPAAHRATAFEREPRIRDAFLRELFEMSYTGAFLETYTSERVMEDLRQKLLAAARLHLGPHVRDVLILDALRQER